VLEQAIVRLSSMPGVAAVSAARSAPPTEGNGFLAQRNVLREVDASLPITDVTTLDARIAELLMPQRFGSALLSTLAGLTVVLVAVGVAGLVGYTVSRRRREIAVRLALGAQRVEVTCAMTRAAVAPAALGVLLGIAASLLLGGSSRVSSTVFNPPTSPRSAQQPLS
jgi:hypothetical protein